MTEHMSVADLLHRVPDIYLLTNQIMGFGYSNYHEYAMYELLPVVESGCILILEEW